MHIIKIGGIIMATTSITKNFSVKDEKAYEELLKKISDSENSKPVRTIIPSSSLKRGNDLLKQFSFRSKT